MPNENNNAEPAFSVMPGSAPLDPTAMTDEYLVQLLLEKYACACDPRCAREMHEWAMDLRRELLKRIACLRADSARIDWLIRNAEPGRERYHVNRVMFSWLAVHHGDLRDAIDSAMCEPNDQAQTPG